jgi:hypothetical protein
MNAFAVFAKLMVRKSIDLLAQQEGQNKTPIILPEEGQNKTPIILPRPAQSRSPI